MKFANIACFGGMFGTIGLGVFGHVQVPRPLRDGKRQPIKG